MKIEHRPQNPEETDYELVFGVLHIPLVALAALVVTRLPAGIIPPCWLHRFTGLPCPTCGTYRALMRLRDGAVVDAWIMQPLVVSLVLLAACYSLYSFVVLARHLPRVRVHLESRREVKIVLALMASVIGLNWLFLILSGR